MKIPKKLRVGGVEYDVEVGYQFNEREDRSGHADEENLEIKICDSGLNGKKFAQAHIEDIFIHEMLHCIDRRYNSGALEEDVVQRLACGLYQVLKENKLLK